MAVAVLTQYTTNTHAHSHTHTQTPLAGESQPKIHFFIEV